MRLLKEIWSIGLFVLLTVTTGSQAHDLSFDSDPSAATISIGSKNYQSGGTNITDQVFRDGLGREASFRGWNVSGSAKFVETGHQSLRNQADAVDAFDTLGEQFGPNVVRLLITWEGVNPAAGQIDSNYLARVAQEIRAAVANHMYVLLDFHQDLYSRYFFNFNSWYTGDGAPSYVIRPGNVGAEYCGWVCVSWAQNQLTNAPIRQSVNDFWYNNTVNGVAVQSAFMWQLGQTLTYLHNNLTAQEFNYILGLDPCNEPFDGGMGGMTSAQWENAYIWPFHQRVRAVMDASGWSGKPDFAELLVYWNSKTPTVPATGGFNLKQVPGSRYVFNAHFYDVQRMGGLNWATVNNGTYFSDIDNVRSVARFWNSPAFLSEFGMSVDGTGYQDPNRITNGMHQAMEVSDAMQASKSRYIDPYVNLVSGTQWQWDYYWNRHQEYMNFNPAKLQTTKDSWNGENYSVIGDGGGSLQYNLSPSVIKRIYPRRAQGDIMHFFFSAESVDKSGNVMRWASIRPRGAGVEYLRNNIFALLVWRGRSSSAPGEMYIPNNLDPTRLVVLTDKTIRRLGGVDTGLQNLPSEVDLMADPVARDPSVAGNRLLFWNDENVGDTPTSWHYALVFQRNIGETWSVGQLLTLQTQLNNTIQEMQQSPVYLTGAMTNGTYPADLPLP